jgi:hypothetical protein
MVIFGGLEIVAAGYLIHEHKKNKRERERVAQEHDDAERLRESAQGRHPRRRNSDDYPRGRRQHSERKRTHQREDARPSGSSSKEKLPASKSSLNLSPKPILKPQRATSAPPPDYYPPTSHAPSQSQVHPDQRQRLQAHTLSEPERYLPSNHYPAPPPLPQAEASSQHHPHYPPYTPRPEYRPSPVSAPATHAYVVPPDGVWELPGGPLSHPNPAIGRLQRPSRPYSPHVHFDDDAASIASTAPPPYRE